MVDTARPPEERIEANDSERVHEFSGGMLLRWQKGRSEYGTTMKLDPFEEARDECLDLANYAMEIYFRLKVLEERTKELR